MKIFCLMYDAAFVKPQFAASQKEHLYNLNENKRRKRKY